MFVFAHVQFGQNLEKNTMSRKTHAEWGVQGPVISNLRLYMKKDKIGSIYHITQKNKFHIEYKNFIILAKNLAVIEGGNRSI